MKSKFSTFYSGNIKFTIVIIIFIITSSFILNAAYLRNIPQTITQPDGTEINCFASGDEYYNWLHDKDGYTIVANPETGWYVYAEKIDGELVPGSNVVGKINPSLLNIEKWLKISHEKIYEKVKSYQQYSQIPGKKDKSETIQVTGTINNIVIFIRFSGEAEFTESTNTYNTMFNSNGGASMKSYFIEASYNNVTVNSTFYPIPDATILSYQDSHVRNYYKPFHSVNNPIGYIDNAQKTNREHTLLKDAVNDVKSQIPSGLNIDFDGNGFVDNVCFVIYGAPGGWSDLLWPHQWSLFSYNVTINGKVVWDYNIQLQTVVNVGVLSHEMFHTFGAPDLYHYNYDGMSPVGSWDIMENNLNPPEHMGAYMKYKYGNWITAISQISSSGTYQLNPITSSSNNCFRINSPFSPTEYFIVEYRRKTGTFESSVPGSGLLVYRINTLAGNGNQEGPPDEIYIYRVDGTTTSNGNINQAFLSADAGRTVISDLTNPSSFLSNGSNGGLILYDVGTPGNTISFKIGFGVMPPNLKSPANSVDGIEPIPLLVWYKTNNAITYDLQVSTLDDLSLPMINLSGITDTTYQILTPLSNGIRYYWRIRTHTDIDTSEWSNIWNFRIILGSPTLVSPLNNTPSQDTSLTLSWSPPFGADTYGLQISTTADFSNIGLDISDITETIYIINGLSHNNKYYWRVNATNAGGTGPWSDAWNFSTSVGPPTLTMPTNHAKRVTDSGYVSWERNPIAVSYRVQISRFPDFSVNIYDQSNVTDTFFLYHGFEFGTIYFWRVCSISDNDISSWSPSWDFTTILAAPNLVFPTNHVSGIPDSVSFQWQSVNQAQSYNLHISPDSTFVTDTINQSGITGLNKIVWDLNNNTKYYWRISAHNPDGDGLWSSIRDFTTQLPPPVLISPNNLATVNPDSGTLRWDAVTGATLYKLKLSENQDFSITIINDSTLTGTSYNYSGLIKNRSYYWKVCGKSADNTGEWSSIWNFATTFEAPTLLYPPNLESGIPKNVEFRWEEINGINFYHIRVSTSQDFSTTLINDSSLIATTFNYNNLTKNTRYYWQVRAQKGFIWGNWSSLWSFSTFLSQPKLSAPPDGNVFLRINDTLRWQQVYGATNYHIQISKSADFNPVIVNDFSITDTIYDYLNLEYNTKYYWRVAGKNSDGNGEWSDVWNFTTRIAIPSPISPVQNDIKIKISGMLTWQSIQGADTYNVQLSENSAFSSKDIDASSVPLTSIYYTNLKYLKDYYWRVSASNSKGTTDWSNTWKFTTDEFNSVSEEDDDDFRILNYPNPVSESAALDITLESDSYIEICLYNMLGEKVSTIFSGTMGKGSHHINWSPSAIPSGIYFITMSNNTVVRRETIVIRR